MAKYRQKPPEYEAKQWHKCGDHPEVIPFKRDGLLHYLCSCGRSTKDHGLIKGDGFLPMVCPGDWVVTSRKETFPIPAHVFFEQYELVKE